MLRRLVEKQIAAGLGDSSEFNASWHPSVSTVRRTGASKPEFDTEQTAGRATTQNVGVGVGEIDEGAIEDELIEEDEIGGAGVESTPQSSIVQREELDATMLMNKDNIDELWLDASGDENIDEVLRSVELMMTLPS